MCVAYGKNPCSYLFPDVECPHFIMLVDTLVFNIGEPPMIKERWERAVAGTGAKLKGSLE